MLNESDYPESLKNRIGSKYGHLNNKEAARILQSIKKNNLNFIGAAHLSEKNNDHNLVRSDVSFALSKDESFIMIIDKDDGLNWTTV